jgi:hypothetical protein
VSISSTSATRSSWIHRVLDEMPQRVEPWWVLLCDILRPEQDDPDPRDGLIQLGERTLELRGYRVFGMGEARRVGDVCGEITHPLDLLRAVHRGENRVQVSGDRGRREASAQTTASTSRGICSSPCTARTTTER